MKQLIVNADGFGFTYGNNRAIFEVLEKGFIRSVSVNVTWPAVEQVKTLICDFPHVTVGVHLNLSVGPAILPREQIPSLLNASGEFHGPAFTHLACRGKLDPKQMRLELAAQIDRVLDLGVQITHWDSHQGRHLYPGFFEAALEATGEKGILATRTHRYYIVTPPKARLRYLTKYYASHPRNVLTHCLAAYRMRCVKKANFRMPDRRLVLDALGAGAVYDPQAWEILLSRMPDGINFIECHPGYVDEQLLRYSSLQESREKEREMFLNIDWLSKAKQCGVEVVSHYVLVPEPANPGEPATPL